MKKWIVPFILGVWLGMGVMSLYLPFHHFHDWTKWEQKDIKVLHIVRSWGKTEVLGEGVSTIEYRSCKTCGHYTEREADYAND